MRIKNFIRLVKLEHTVFALPFAYLGAVMAKGGLFSPWQFFWITMAMAGARTAGMGLNRIADREIDAKNPRTSNRELPRNIIKVWEVWILVSVSLAILTLSSAMLNFLCLILSPVPVAMLFCYSHLKKFTWVSHFCLGTILGCAPVAGWLAVTGTFHIVPLLLGFAVMCWVAGFDVIYSCQDTEFDRHEGLYSISAVFGMKNALGLSAVLHGIAFVLLITVGLVMKLEIFFWIGLALVGGLLVYQHRIISPSDMSRANEAFFVANGFVSVVLLLFTCADILIRG
jgi:4-hydroxybenzoate polyprenyltransferase